MIKKILIIIILLIPLYGCQTVQNTTNNVVEKEEKYLQKFIHQKIEKVIQEFGEPTQYFAPDPESGGGKLIYNTKKLGIKCVRTFEVDESERVVGFSSKGCFWLVGKTPTSKVKLI